MPKKQRLTPSTRAYMEAFLAKVETARACSYDDADEQRILAQMESEDDVIRAAALRDVCPCRMPWEVFHRLRKAAKRLQHDPSPLVRANARHIEEDARMVASFEMQIERTREYEEQAQDVAQKAAKPWRRRPGAA